jgi:ATP-binding cassette, subfamily B, bacterial PglK
MSELLFESAAFEALSSDLYDVEEPEREVMTAVAALLGDKIVLTIARRLSTMRRCDRILVPEKGRLVGASDLNAPIECKLAFQRKARVA